MVSQNYLNKIRRAVRRLPDTDIDEELIDIIEECREDLQSIGVLASKTNDETDKLILGAVRCFARWKFGSASDDGMANQNDYMALRGELNKKGDYIA